MMNSGVTLENVSCPCCRADQSTAWASENGFQAVRCNRCRFIYLNPRPSDVVRDRATQLGAHAALEGSDMTEHHSPTKVQKYKRLLGMMFDDVWSSKKPIRWLDVGAGYGEVVEAVASLAPEGSVTRGLEPMAPKVAYARRRGIDLQEGFLEEVRERFDIVSSINVLSHVNDPAAFIKKFTRVLQPGGQVLIETGDMGNVESRSQFPSILDLPDHVGFSTMDNIETMLKQAGLHPVRIHRARIDGLGCAIKSLVKKLLGRPSILAIPYLSPYRRLVIRAEFKP
jgi:2-polyprenyl-3-methyl-5-hydroxy-6-metoxy-1,4-benzoquinol methylase